MAFPMPQKHGISPSSNQNLKLQAFEATNNPFSNQAAPGQIASRPIMCVTKSIPTFLLDLLNELGNASLPA
jgi:hypothetical protein